MPSTTTLSSTIRICDAKHNDTQNNDTMLKVVGHYGECHNNSIILSFVMLNAVAW